MIRLTEKRNLLYFGTDGYIVSDGSQKFFGSLEDLEEEIGIDLITLFKATQQGIWMKHNKDFYFFDNLMVDFKNKCLVQIVSNDEVETFPFDSYGEDWGLTKEELEND